MWRGHFGAFEFKIAFPSLAPRQVVFKLKMPSTTDFLSDLSQHLNAFSLSHSHPPAPERRRRPAHIVISSQRGDIFALESEPIWLGIDERQKCIRFFVSSTFDDTKYERDVLIKCVVPILQRYARFAGFEVILSEMRFGIRKGLADSHKTTEVCMAELVRCLETSAGLSFMLLSCSRYGFRAPPRLIPICDMNGLISCMTLNERLVALEYYVLDENVLRTPQECYNISVNMHGASNVQGSAYVLQNVAAVPQFWDRFHLLQLALRNASSKFWPNALNMHLRDPQSQHPLKFFFISITEEEICRAVFWRDSALVKHSVHVFRRTLRASGGTDLQEMPTSEPELKNYIDLSIDKKSADLDASRLLSEQQHMLAATLSQAPACLSTFQPLEWQAGQGLNPFQPQHAAYLQRFAEECLTCLLNSTDEARVHLAVEDHADMSEAIFHLNFAMKRASRFAHSNETRHVTEPLDLYLSAESCGGHSFIIWGASGSGKTYLMAEAAHRVARSIQTFSDTSVIIRFLGTTPASSSVSQLLFSICKQLHVLHRSSFYVAKGLYFRDLASEHIQEGELRHALKCARKALRSFQVVLSPIHHNVSSIEQTICLIKHKRFCIALKDSSAHKSAVQHMRDSGSVAILRHRGGGFASSDYSLQFREFNSFIADVKLRGAGFYFEVEVLEIVKSGVQYGCCTSGFESLKDPRGQGVGDDKLSWGVCGHRQEKWHGSDASAFGSKWSVGDIIGFMIDMRISGAAVLSVSVNGSFASPNGVVFSDIDAPYMSPAFSGNGVCRINLGDRPFAYVPPCQEFLSVHAFWQGTEETHFRISMPLFTDLKFENEGNHDDDPIVPTSQSGSEDSDDSESSDEEVYDPFPSDMDFEDLQRYFKNTVQNWADGRLVIFLDSVDQLDDSLGGRRLNWLPMFGLAPGVRIVVSSLPDDLCPPDGQPFACLSSMQSRHQKPSFVVEVRPVNDVPHLFLHLMKLQKRTLTANQLAVLDVLVKKSPRTQTPLVVTILANRLSEWPSHADLDPGTIDTSSVRALIIQEFKALEAKHGVELVQATLSFITLAQNGVSETELSEILSLDDDVLASVYEWWVPPVRTLPTNPLTMLLNDLKPYLTWRGAAGGSYGLMMRWYHRQFWEAADEYFLFDANERKRRHSQLGEFFSGAWAGCSKPYSDRLKTVVQKKLPGEISGDRQVRPQPLCLREGKNIFCTTKGDADAVNERRCREAAHHWLEAGMFLEAAKDLCSFEGIFARAFCGAASTTSIQLSELNNSLRQQARSPDVCELHQLVEHFSKWLRKDFSSIVANLDMQVLFDSCCRQPEFSIVRKDLVKYMQRTSAGLSFTTGSLQRSFVLGTSLEDFDPLLSVLKYHQGHVYDVEYNFDCSLLASASADQTVAIWNTKAGMVEFALQGFPKGGINLVAWAPNGAWLLTADSDGKVALWDLSTKHRIAEIRDYPQYLCNSVAFDSNSEYLATTGSASWGSTVRLWHLGSQLMIAEQWHNSACLDRSGKYLVTGSSDDNVLRVWDMTRIFERLLHEATFVFTADKVIAVLEGHKHINAGAVYALDGSGRYMASSAGGLIIRPHTEPVDCTVRVWDLKTQQEVAVLNGHSSSVISIAFDGSGKFLATGSGLIKFFSGFGSQSSDNTVRIWEVSTHQQVAVLQGHTSAVTSVAFDKSGMYLTSGSYDNTVRVWEVSIQQRSAASKGHRSAVICVAFDGSGKYLASASRDNTVRLWDVSTQQQVAVLIGHTNWVNCVAFDVSGKFLISGSSDLTIRVWDVGTHQQVAELKGHTSSILSVAFDGSGKYMASASRDNSVRLWDAITQTMIALLKGHTDWVNSVAFDEKGTCVASGSWDNTVRLWDIATQQQVAELKGHSSTVLSVAFDGSGKFLASGSRDESVRIWDIDAQKEVAVLQGHRGTIISVVFIGSGKYLASGCSDNTVCVWDVETQQQVTALKGHTSAVLSVALDRSGKHLASGSEDNTVRLWDVSSHQEIAYSCSL